jgi:hypothetical protein
MASAGIVLFVLLFLGVLLTLPTLLLLGLALGLHRLVRAPARERDFPGARRR